MHDVSDSRSVTHFVLSLDLSLGPQREELQQLACDKAAAVAQVRNRVKTRMKTRENVY